MCFIVDTPCKIAKKDIVCYKRFYKKISNPNTIYSPYQYYQYKLNTCYYEDMFDIFGEWMIKYGFHSHSSLRSAKKETYSAECILKCIIPEGANYYYNEYNKEYVSDYIKIGKKTNIIK